LISIDLELLIASLGSRPSSCLVTTVGFPFSDPLLQVDNRNGSSLGVERLY